MRDGDGTKERLKLQACEFSGHVRTTFPFSVAVSVYPNRLTAEMPPTFLEKRARDQYEALVDRYDTWLFDCDGVLWNGDRPVDGAKEVLEMLRRKSARTILSGYVLAADLDLSGLDKSIIFVTNNATKSRRKYKKKFDDLGIDATVVWNGNEVESPENSRD